MEFLDYKNFNILMRIYYVENDVESSLIEDELDFLMREHRSFGFGFLSKYTKFVSFPKEYGVDFSYRVFENGRVSFKH